MIRLCIIINPSFGLTLAFAGRWEYMVQRGFLCAAIAGPGAEHREVRRRGVRTWEIPIERYPSPWKDLVSLVRIWWCLIRHRFDVIGVSTPKASFLGMLAARLSGHSKVLYLVRGRAYENMTGLKRRFMNACEWLTCRLATVVVPISHELGRILVDEGLCSGRKIRMVGAGSSKGVDLDRFTRTEEHIEQGRSIRRQLGIADDDLLILFVGWLRRDKGVNELIRAFRHLAEQYPRLHLLTLGDYDPSDPLEADVEQMLRTHPRIHRLEWRPDPVPAYAAADMMAFPSHREGFGNVALEASAMELAVVTSDIPGCREAVVRDVTGLLVPKEDSEALAAALKRLIDAPGLRLSLARNGRERVERDFRQENVWEGQLQLYREVAGEARSPEHRSPVRAGIRVCIIINPSFGLTLAFEGRWEYMTQRGFLCAAIAGPGAEHREVRRRGVRTWEIPIERYPNPWKDLVSLGRIWLCLVRHRFDVVEVSTPKASFLGVLAARLSGHSKVVYVVLGRAYENMTGLKRKLMNTCEWLTCTLATVVVPVSHELGRILVDEGLCSARKIRMVGAGSPKGVDLSRFTRTEEHIEQGRSIRRQLGIADDDLVILFVGWLRRDKGVNELIRAFRHLAEQYPRLHLLTLGDYEPSDPLEADVEQTLRTHPRIHRLEWRPDPVPAYAAADMMAFPSYREGLPSVALEASAMELAVAASDIPGCREAVVRDVTGLLVPKGDSEALAAALKRLIDDPGLRLSLARNGRERVERDFRQENVWEGQLQLYREVAGG